MNACARLLALLLLVPPAAALAAGARPQAPVLAPVAPSLADATPGACRLDAFVRDTDPAGLNVRSEPSTRGRILGTLPPVVASTVLEGYPVRTEVTITGHANGWFRIEDARDNPELTGLPARPVFAGSGWVSGRQLTVKSQAGHGYLQPDATSQAVLRLGDDGSFDGDAMVAAGALIACRGEWALVEFADAALPADFRPLVVTAPEARAGLPAGRFRAWLNRLCGIQETRCDGD